MNTFNIQLAEAFSAFESGEWDAAEAQIQSVLAKSPGNAQAYFALAMVHAARGDLQSACDSLERCLKSAPQFAPARERLAILTFQMGRFDLAETRASSCLEADPGSFECLQIRGCCAELRGDFELAADSFGRASKLRPQEPFMLVRLGSVLARLARPMDSLAALSEASRWATSAESQIEISELLGALGLTKLSLAACETALKSKPDSFPANLIAAKSLVDLGEVAASGPYWQAAELLEPHAGQTRVAKSVALALNGHFAKAREEALEAIQRSPDRGKPYYVLTAAAEMTAADEPIMRRMRMLVSAPQTSLSDRIDLLYALGKAHDDLGDYESAIGYFDAANAARSLPFDRQRFRRDIDKRIDLFPLPAKNGRDDDEAVNPVFVIGMIRSGTTLVDRILSSHSQIGSAGEQPFWPANAGRLVDFRSGSIDEAAAGDLIAEYRAWLQTLVPAFGAIVDKNPANLMQAGLLHHLFPNSRIVCTRRNSADTALSIWMTQMSTEAPFVGSREDIVFALKETARLMDHWRGTIPPSRYRELRYESLVAAPESQARGLIEFAGFDWEEACMDPSAQSQGIKTPSFWQARQPIYQTSMERWRRYEPWLGPFAELVEL